MKSVGIICEYNPFHNGHIYHLEKTKELFPDSAIILIMSSHFMQRGEISIINKWEKTEIALKMGIDLVIELPFPFATQSADIFARGAIEILDALKVEAIVFGSECADIHLLQKLASIQMHNDEYNCKIKQYIKKGFNYPTACAKALNCFKVNMIDSPNDLLALGYIKAIDEKKSKIKPIPILRIGEYHNLNLQKISSASAIRNAIKDGKDITYYIPSETKKHLNHIYFNEDYFPFLKYQILLHLSNLQQFQTVDESIASRIKKHIYESETLESLIQKIKTKRYTYNRISRMFTHILCNFTKEEAMKFSHIEYIRVLGFNQTGRKYLNEKKKEITLPIVTNFGSYKNAMLDLEMRITSVYATLLPENKKKELIEKEFKMPPIQININTFKND